MKEESKEGVILPDIKWGTNRIFPALIKKETYGNPNQHEIDHKLL